MLASNKDIELGNMEENAELLSRDLSNVSDQKNRPQILGRDVACSDQPYNNRSYHPSLPLTTDETTLSGICNRRDNHIRILNTQLLEAIGDPDTKEVERLLKAGVNPDATCRLAHESACHVAALECGDVLGVLLKSGAIKDRRDERGRRPLHLAAWSGSTKNIAILLDLPDELQNKLADDKMSLETEEDIKNLRPQLAKMANVQCDFGVLLENPETWEDSLSHSCRDMRDHLPSMDIGWTPLHAASSNARPQCARLLLAAGADPNLRDFSGRTSVDVAGSAFYHTRDIKVDCFREVIKVLLEAGSELNTDQVQTVKYSDSPLHVAVELENLDATKELLDAGASVTCLDRNGQTPLHLCVKKRLKKLFQIIANHNANLMLSSPLVDVENNEGYTPLHVAVIESWVPGVCVALEAGADATIKRFKNQKEQTPLHSAAQWGNLNVLKEILNVIKHSEDVNCVNEYGVTALFPAVLNGNIKCVQEILNAGVSIKKCASNNFNVLHLAAKCRHFNILKVLLNHDNAAAEDMLNERDTEDNFTPILYAINSNHPPCFNLLFSKHKEISSKTGIRYNVSELLLEAIHFDRIDIAYDIIHYDKMSVHAKVETDLYYNPFDYAIYRGSTDILKLLIRNGASLLTYVDDQKITGIAAIFSGRSSKFVPEIVEINYYDYKPTEFLESLFDELIYKNPNCVITIDYRILTPDGCETEMKVLRALIETGNKNGQRRLLLHPLVDSFTYLKWLALRSIFYAILFLNGLFVLSLNIFIMSFYSYKDTGEVVPGILDPDVWKYIVYVTVSFVGILDYTNMISKSVNICYKIYKVIFLAMVIALPSVITAKSLWDAEWPRHLATVVLLISWLDMMLLLSQTPYAGYYVLMFRKVAKKVMKILLIFLFLIMAFAFSFTIQFHSKEPFENPWAAFVKTMVMMTSEFDYSGTFVRPNDTETNKQIQMGETNPSIFVCRVLFLVFLIFTAIVLMNLILGVAVNDLHSLVMKRKIKRLKDRVMFLDSLEAIAYHRWIPNFLKTYRGVKPILNILPRDLSKYKMPKYMIEAIYNHIEAQQEMKDDEKYIMTYHAKLAEKDRLCRQRENMNVMFKKKNDSEVVLKHLDEVNIEVNQIQLKLDQMFSKMKCMKQTLGRLENKH